MVHRYLLNLWEYRKIIIVFLTPLLLLPLSLVPGTNSASCGYVIILMAVYWITESLPLAVTSLIPLMLFPMMGILTSKQVSVLYFKDTNWLMFGGLVIAVAVETSGLHKRIALRVLMLVGVKPRWLILGFMSVSFFLSMWISNTATTAMILPIVEAIIKELYGNKVIANECDSPGSFKNEAFDMPDEKGAVENHGEIATPDLELEDIKVEVEDEPLVTKKKRDLVVKGITICIPYSASIGGTATLTGTVPNLVLSGQYEVLFPEATQQLSYGIWITYSLPPALVMLFLTYLWISCWFLGFNIKEMFPCFFKKVTKNQSEINAERILRMEYEKLGKMNWEEVTVLLVFILTALLWFFRDPGFMPGWSVIFSSGFVSDGTVAVVMAFTLFILPKRKPEFFKRFWKKNSAEDNEDRIRSVPAVLVWPTTQRMFPWDVSLLLGAGFAIAQGATDSGLSSWLGEQMAVLKGIDDWVICLIVTAFVCLMTETTSNTATASLFVPILAELAKTLEIHPLYMLLPPVVAASFAFMLPVATPPNAIAFSYGRISVWDLVKAGWVVNILGILVITLFINTYGVAFFGLREFPEWANITDSVVTQSPAVTNMVIMTTEEEKNQ